MWQASGPRIRSAKRSRDKVRLRNALHLQRVAAEVRLTPRLGEKAEIFIARMVLNDFSPKGVGFFCKAPVNVGTDLAITLEHPKRIFLKAHVIWCQELENANAVISDEAHHYRVGVKFVFQGEEEEKAVQAFCDEILRQLLPQQTTEDESEGQAA